MRALLKGEKWATHKAIRDLVKEAYSTQMLLAGRVPAEDLNFAKKHIPEWGIKVRDTLESHFLECASVLRVYEALADLPRIADGRTGESGPDKIRSCRDLLSRATPAMIDLVQAIEGEKEESDFKPDEAQEQRLTIMRMLASVLDGQGSTAAQLMRVEGMVEPLFQEFAASELTPKLKAQLIAYGPRAILWFAKQAIAAD